MVRRFLGALFRGVCAGLVLLIPSLMLVHVPTDATYFVLISCILFAFIVFSEYNNTYPSILEFRDAPPFNRIRFLHGIMSVYGAALIFQEIIFGGEPGAITRFAIYLGWVLDFTGSPVDMLMMSVPQDLPETVLQSMRAAGALTMALCAISIMAFYLYIKFTYWPVSRGQFNIWINLPLMDPARGDDLAKRMKRRAQLNIGLGVSFLFAVLVFFKGVGAIMGLALFYDLVLLIWIIILWGVIPTTMVMRGIAMARLATEIAKKQTQGAAKSNLLTA